MQLTLKKDECNYLDVARFIGIFLVVLAHFGYIYNHRAIPSFIFQFHMPLFFFISGILHKDIKISWKSLWNIFYSLVLTYILYNVIAYCIFVLRGREPGDIGELLLSHVTMTRLLSIPTWFFLSLFWVKFIAFFLHSKKMYIIISVLCLVLITIADTFIPLVYWNILTLKTSIMAFPFFAIGYLMKDFFCRKIHIAIKIICPVLCLLLGYLFAVKYGGIHLFLTSYVNLPTLYIFGLTGSMSIIFLSQVILKFVKSNFVKDMSRGTMLIVGLHYVIMYDFLDNIFWGNKPLREILFLSIILFLSFYPIIKLTYNRIPILYGKKYKKLCKP